MTLTDERKAQLIKEVMQRTRHEYDMALLQWKNTPRGRRSEQPVFDEMDCFLKLAFMNDASLVKLHNIVAA